MDVVLIQHIDDLWECGCDVYTFFVLNALYPLKKDFLYKHGKIFSRLTFRSLIEVHEHCNEWCLTVTGHERHQLLLDRLYTIFYFLSQTLVYEFVYLLRIYNALFNKLLCFCADLLPAYVDKWSKMCKTE